MYYPDDKAMQAYEEAFDESRIAHEEPSGTIVIIDYINNKTYDLPEAETENTFYDRIQRSIECGRNLFYEECPLYDRAWMHNPMIDA